MSDYASVLEPGSVRFERRLPGPIERVWEYLTDPELRGTWFASGPMELRPGGKVEFRFEHSRLAPPDEIAPEKYKDVDGLTSTVRVTRCEPPRLLAFTWTDAPVSETSEVIFELAPLGDDVRLTLTHRRLPNRSETVDVSAGWHLHLGVLEGRLRGRALAPFWARLAELDEAYVRRIPGPLVVEKSIEIEASAERVWRVLIEPEQNAKWAGEFGATGPIEADWKPGGAVLWRNAAREVYVHGSVVAFEPNELLRITVCATKPELRPASGRAEDEITQTYVLSARGGRTLLSIAHGDFAKLADGEKRFPFVVELWERLLPKLKALAES